MDEGCRFFSSHLSKSKDEAFNEAKNNKRAVSSFTESALMVDILKTEGYDVIEAAGAGYKVLAVIQGKLNLKTFIIMASTFKLKVGLITVTSNE